MAEISKILELYRLKADMFDEDISPAQKKFYKEAADWMEAQGFRTAEEATEGMKNTPYYTGGAKAKFDDDEYLRKKVEAEFNPEGDSLAVLLEKKECFHSIFRGYMNTIGNPEESFIEEILNRLKRLESLGTSFDALATKERYRKMTLLTDEGMANFIDFVHRVETTGKALESDMSDIAEEEARIEKWAQDHKRELVDVGKKEKWHHGSCVAAPAENPIGYEFIALKEVER